ncbi:ECF family RNA polymerase sigma factor (plasmid) [Ketogulonicigenium robustum]|uniref:ECF family RNA polymerase sigma factor n=1 Tax=Ketogulonicigenium robustum TaxID=92947 RepID=A0A1W6P2T3_9RHOB|nr:ECF family RNA polymerase sigma factor [Ketogulonicigenium robustum]
MQEAWLRVRRHAPAVLAAPLPYMMRVMRNLVIDHGRVRARRLRQAEVDALLEVPGDLPSPEDAAIARSQLRLFARALAGLPLRRREILIAARLRRVPYAQIAAQHGVSVRTVEYEVRLALDHCIAAMAAAEDGYRMENGEARG